MRGCRYTKLIDSRYIDNRYRYHKNAIINKDISSLVGSCSSSSYSSLPSSLLEQCNLFIVLPGVCLGTMIKSLNDSHLSEGLIDAAR